MITYITGDASLPETKNDIRKRHYIVHVCNNISMFGSGFAKALNDRSLLPKQNFLEHSKRYTEAQLLGNVCFSDYIHKIKVVNMIAQNGVRSQTNPTPIKYDALEECMNYVEEVLIPQNTIIHGPKFGSGLAGGDWNIIEQMINNIWKEFDVRIYELEK